MLDEKDLQAIAKMISDSEARTAERIDAAVRESEARMSAKIGESEARMSAKIGESEARTGEKIREAESHMLAMMEAYFDPKFNLLADQIKLLEDKMVTTDDLIERDDRLDVLEAVVKRHSREIEKLKKAQ